MAKDSNESGVGADDVVAGATGAAVGGGAAAFASGLGGAGLAIDGTAVGFPR